MNGVHTHIMFKFGVVPHDRNVVVECLYQICSVCRPAISDLVRLLLLPASIQQLLSAVCQVVVDLQSSVGVVVARLLSSLLWLPGV